eukprot:952211-Pyramimonas_sp.AAC.1
MLYRSLSEDKAFVWFGFDPANPAAQSASGGRCGTFRAQVIRAFSLRFFAFSLRFLKEPGTAGAWYAGAVADAMARAGHPRVPLRELGRDGRLLRVGVRSRARRMVHSSLRGFGDVPRSAGVRAPHARVPPLPAAGAAHSQRVPDAASRRRALAGLEKLVGSYSLVEDSVMSR